MVADPGYDVREMYDLTTKREFHLVYPVKRYRSTQKKRLNLADFYESSLGQIVYQERVISVEPLIEHIKSVFRIDSALVRGYEKVSGIILLSVLLYQILVYYNCKIQKDNPVRAINYLIGC